MMNSDYTEINFDSIPFIVEEQIIKIEQDLETLKQMSKNLEHIYPEKEFHTPLIKYKMGWMLPSMIESMITKMEEEKSLYENAFNAKMVQGIVDSLENIDIIKSSRPINEKIIHARIEILRFERSGLGEKDYERDIAAIRKKIDDVSKYTEVHSPFKFPNLPHRTLKELVYYLCNAERSQHLHFPIIPKETAKEISLIISKKQRLPRKQEEYDEIELKKELYRIELRSRHGKI